MGHSEWPMTQVTHWALDSWPMWPMIHGSSGPLPHTSASLTQIYRLPCTVFGHCICTHTFKLLLNCTCKQTAHTGTCKLEFWYIIITTIYKASHRVKKLMGHGSTPSDPCDPSDFLDPFDPWHIDPFPALYKITKSVFRLLNFEPELKTFFPKYLRFPAVSGCS